MKIHELKTWSEPFAAVWRGDKPYEIRKDDRDFAVGDMLTLREWSPVTREYLGAWIQAEVTHITSGEWGIAPGLCVLGIKVTEFHKGDGK